MSGPILNMDRILRIGIAVCFAAAAFACAPSSSAQSAADTSAVAAPPSDPPAPPATATPRMEAAPSAGMLEGGFRNLYELNFKGGRDKFVSYQRLEPRDPMGKAAEAASYLYEQFNNKGIFTSEFFMSDEKFLGGAIGTPAENQNDDFLNSNHAAREMAESMLKSDPQDRQALLVLTMTDGMEADYDAL